MVWRTLIVFLGVFSSYRPLGVFKFAILSGILEWSVTTQVRVLLRFKFVVLNICDCQSSRVGSSHVPETCVRFLLSGLSILKGDQELSY